MVQEAKRDGRYRQLERYYKKRPQILREAALRNAYKRGAAPTPRTMDKHNISWQDLAEYLLKEVRK